MAQARDFVYEISWSVRLLLAYTVAMDFFFVLSGPECHLALAIKTSCRMLPTTTTVTGTVSFEMKRD